ncbi:hypothetical protein IV203_001454 [Nitzschia inconspicua]|uniref:Uncharacterized protein n=1 Tax=Nitzschia inconspicua TaxID=303405 RepID=A0A9K3L7B6_9STRA|nr:hypothetical protein IV203_001454 [Nitzschia inconspicua]
MVHGSGSRSGSRGGGDENGTDGRPAQTPALTTNSRRSTTNMPVLSRDAARKFATGGTGTSASSGKSNDVRHGGGSRTSSRCHDKNSAPTRMGGGTRSSPSVTNYSRNRVTEIAPTRMGGGTRSSPSVTNQNRNSVTETAPTRMGGGTRSSPSVTNQNRNSATETAPTRMGGGTRSSPSVTNHSRNRATETAPTRMGGGTRSSPGVTNQNRNSATETAPTRMGGGTRSSPSVTIPDSVVPSRHGVGNRSTRRTTNFWHNGRSQDALEVPLLRQEENSNADQDDAKCCRWCCFCCCCSICLKSLGYCCSFLAVAIRPGRSISVIAGLGGTALLFATLVVFSGYTEYWTLNAGESRQVHYGWLTREVDIQVVTPNTSVFVDVFTFRNKCPALNGPIVTVHHQLEMAFNPGDYQYNYFYLNLGSKIEATLTQNYGSSMVYLLRGQDKIDTLGKPSHSNPNWLNDLLRKYVKKWQVKSNTYQPTVAEFRASQSSDEHVLVYDNPYKTRGHLSLDLWLDLTTYDVEGYVPRCSDVAFQNTCHSIQTEFAKCIIVDTYPSSNNGSKDEVRIAILGYRDYYFITMLSIIPAVLVVFLQICCWSRKSGTILNESASGDSHTAIAEPYAYSRVPASFAPSPSELTEPTASPAWEDSAQVPLVTAELVEGGPPPKNASAPLEPIPPPSLNSGK